MDFHHVSVLLEEMLDGVVTAPDGIYVDCTVGGGGHAHALAGRLNTNGLIIGIDQDEEAICAAEERLRDVPCPHVLVRENFSQIEDILQAKGIELVDGFIFDLGVSSHQLDEGARGFSYMHDGRLDMRMDQRNFLTAYEVVNQYSEDELEQILWKYGEEHWARRIAQFIVEQRKIKPVETTMELVHILKMAIPAGARKDGPHPAKRTFQAIRIEVNGELRILEDTMRVCVRHLKSGGRLGVITFQSLEDRIIKRVFKEMSQDCLCPPGLPVCVCHHHREVKKPFKPIRPGSKEVEVNPRSRSAVLRIVEKL